ncbi:hypothetical protein MNBD_PLANCTO03-1672 [hydrothermal vent metagenome]|uniref:Peptidase M12B domain-containing protein n=1 Tax=hydrothermal vent metagenome TaxID=652676 RepID=A0A3B1DKY3_9ZZZZ
MRNQLLGLLALLGVGFFPGTLLAQQSQDDIRQIVQEELELADFSIQRLDLPADNVSFITEIALDGTVYGVWIDPQSFRTENARATIVDAQGNLVDIPLPAPLTVRGQIEGLPEARAAGSRMGGGLHLTIALPGAHETEIWSVQPLSDAIEGADPALHVVHRADDMDIKEHYTCGVDDNGLRQVQNDGDNSGNNTRALLVCELAVDADFEFYGRNGNSEANTIADIDTVIARTSAAYESQCNVTFVIPHYQIWTTSNDPYTSSDAGTRLTQVRNWWNSNMGGVNRDLCHAFTGVNLNGNIIGVAWLSAVCGPNGYGLAQSRYTNNMNSRSALTSHEIGHNFSAGHCDGSGDCHIMCSGLGGCNGLGNPAYFGVASANKITNYAANRPCLDEGGLSYPFLEEWPTTTINADTWPTNNGGVSNTNGTNEPSSPNSLNLDGTDNINSASISLADVTETPFVSFYAQHKGVEAGETLTFEYKDFFGDWAELITVTSDGNDQTDYTYHTAAVPVTGWWSDFALRFSVQGSDSGDDWYVDDIAVAPFAGNPVPLLEEFTSTSLDQNIWGTVTGTVNTDATNEPSDPYSLNLDNAESAESNAFLMGSASFPTYFSFFTQHKGVENGKTLDIEYFSLGGTWENFMTITSDGNDQGSFQFHQAQVEVDSYHDNFAFRFSANGNDGSDDWYIDDIRLGDEFTPPDDCIADFNGDGSVNTQDMLAFLNAWNAGDSSADINGDGEINTQDVLAFLNLWNIGC